MTGRTHLTWGIAAGLLVAAATHGNPALCLAAGALGGLLPDIDHPQSMISGYIPGSSFILGLGGVRHRGFTHSIIFMVLLVAAWFAASQRISIPYPLLIAALAGIASHILGDMLTPQGVRLLFPLRSNWKFLPGVILQLGKLFGVLEFAVWLGALAGIAAGLFLLVRGVP